MNFRSTLYLLLCCSFSTYPAVFDFGRPVKPAQKLWYPWNAYFNSLYAQTELATGKYPVKAKISGYVLCVPFWDTRQVESIFEGLFLYAPLPVKCDPVGKDINSTGQANIAVLETRGRAKLYGPKILGAESFGYLETDFLGSGIVASRLRCRLAFLKLFWKEVGTYFLTGLYYHPIRLAHIDLDPKVISRNAGAPLHPNARTPQVKVGTSWRNKIHLEYIAMGQFDVTDFGPDGRLAKYMNRSLTPMMDVRFWIGPDDLHHLIGVGFDIKRIMPQLVTNNCYKTRSSLTSIAFDIYAKLTAEPLSVRTQFVWAQDGTAYNMIGGYAVSCIDSCTGKRSYTNFNTLSYWIDFNVDTKISPGLFAGYSKILGTSSPIIPSITNPLTGVTENLVYTNLPNIAYMARLSPRIRFNYEPLVFGAELEWTRAGYGTTQESGHITNTTPVSNIRFLLASYYFF